MMKCTIFLGFQHFVLFNGLQWELLLIYSREKSFFAVVVAAVVVCPLLPEAGHELCAWCSSSLLDFPVMSHRGPLSAFLLHPSRERPSAKVAEAGEEGGSCGSENYRIFGGEQQVTIRVWIRAGRLQSYMGVWGLLGGWVAYRNKLSDYRAKI